LYVHVDEASAHAAAPRVLQAAVQDVLPEVADVVLWQTGSATHCAVLEATSWQDV